MHYLHCIFAVLLLGSCTPTYDNLENDMKLLQGEWRSIRDDNWILSFQADLLIDTYLGEVPENCKYSLTTNSCDKSYSVEKFTYLNRQCEEPLCYEIVGLTDSLFSFRETTTARLHRFRKVDSLRH